MLTKFKVSSSSIRVLKSYIGTIDLLDLSGVNDSFYGDILSLTTGDDGIIDGSKLQSMNFPSLLSEYDVFISYSHKDESEALYLASWLNNYCGLSCFLDSTVWNSADDLLKEIDDQYCWQSESQTYNYYNRNFSTSHVHVMLTMAMHDIINRSECCIVIDSDQSMPIKSGIETCTLSPWIYEEVTFIKHMRAKLPTRFMTYRLNMFSDGGQLCEAREGQPLKVKYKVDLTSFPSLYSGDLQKLQGGGYGALDNLYVQKKVFKI